MPIVKVKNLSKKYIISHQALDTSLRDVISEKFKAVGSRIMHPFTSSGSSSSSGSSREDFWALQDVSFEIKQGERVGIIGRNGAGKSTLLKLLSRITEPTAGSITLAGRVVSLLEVGTGFHPDLTGRENVFLNGAILGMSKVEIKKKFDEIVAFSEVEKFLDTPVKRYSSGMYVRLAFSVAAHLEPEILIVDEVLAVGDLQFQKKCLGKMEEVGKDGRTILFVSHQLHMIENLCARTILLNKGILELQGETKEVLAYYLREAIEESVAETNLETRSNRNGDGSIIFTSFHIEDCKGNKLSAVQSGMDIIFTFGYRSRKNKTLKNVDIGFSIHSIFNNQTFAVLYSSYKGEEFGQIPAEGFFYCRVDHFPFSVGRYRIGGRITVEGIDADWLLDGVGFLDVIEGDFFGSGYTGFGGNAPFLIDGKWSNS